MTATTESAAPPRAYQPEKATALALRLAHAEHALLTLTSGQVDAIVAPSGATYLLRPAQEQLRQSEKRWRAVVESAADVILVVNRGGVILSQNRAVCPVLGYGPEELAGSNLFELIAQEDLSVVHSAFFNVIEEIWESATVAIRHRMRDGSWRPIEATVGKLHEGDSSNVVFVMRPVPDPREHPRRTFPCDDAGPPRAPIEKSAPAVIAPPSRAPLSRPPTGPRMDARRDGGRSTLKMIRLHARAVATWAVPPPEEGTPLQMRLEWLDAHEAVGFVLETCRHEIAAAQMEVLLYLRAPQSVVRGDSARLQQVMWKLIRNAIKFSGPGSTLSIQSAPDADGGFTLEFADSGIGIEPGFLPMVFDRLQQGDRYGQRYAGGRGLGMFIAKGLTEAQGGSLTVSSAGRGKGTTFRLSFATRPEGRRQPG